MSTTPSAPPTPAAVAIPAAPGPNVLGAVSLGLAILGAVLAAFPITSFVAGAVLLPALVLAIIGLLRRGSRRGTSIAGLIVAIGGGVLAVVVSLATLVVGASLVDDGVVPESELRAGIGETITNDDGIGFTVDAVECGLATSGPEFGDVVPVGEFCRVEFREVNGGSSQTTLFAADVSARSAGATVVVDDTSARFGGAEGYYDLEIDDEVAAVVFFDVSPGAGLERIDFWPLLGLADPVSVTIG